MKLDPEDGASLDKWVLERLQPEVSVLAYNNCSDSPPAGSSITPTSFCLILQCDWKRDIAKEIGNGTLHIDGTHNVSQYVNMNLVRY